MKLEPVAWTHESYLHPATLHFEAMKKPHPSFPVPLYAIPPGYKLVPVEPTEEWIANMRKGTIEPQGMDAQAKIIENLRRNYKRWIAAQEE